MNYDALAKRAAIVQIMSTFQGLCLIIVRYGTPLALAHDALRVLLPYANELELSPLDKDTSLVTPRLLLSMYSFFYVVITAMIMTIDISLQSEVNKDAFDEDAFEKMYHHVTKSIYGISKNDIMSLIVHL